MAGSLTITSSAPYTTPQGNSIVSLAISLAGISSQAKETIVTSLSNGDNDITAATGAKAMILVPPTSNTVAVTLKGIDADTGFAISKTQPTVIAIDSAINYVINAGAAIATFQVIYV